MQVAIPISGQWDHSSKHSSIAHFAHAAIHAPPSRFEDDVPAVHVLIVDDEGGLRRSLARILIALGFRVGTAEDGVAGLAYIERNHPDVALVDMKMPEMDGLEMLMKSKSLSSPVEIIMMTAFADIEVAIAAVKAGAYHFLTKPFHSNEEVAVTVRKAAEHKRLVHRASRLEEQLRSKEQFGELIGTSPKMQGVYRLIEGVAATSSTVLVLGESGTGKELVARAIHQRSTRAAKPFSAINCAAIPHELVESELFGHVRGAFTGALTPRAGLFESANDGTVFLDEVGELPLAAQVKLLRTLQEGEVKRVGSNDTKSVDVRVLAATNVDLQKKIADGEFRKDLFYRLQVIVVTLPPLKEREDDVMLLAYHFLQKLARRMARDPKRLSPGAVRALRSHTWPGNVRELEHAIEHAFVLSPGGVIHDVDFPFFSTSGPDVAVSPVRRESIPLTFAPEIIDLPYPDAKRRLLTLFDAAYTEELLRRARGNFSEAARQAGLDRSNFRRVMRRRKGQ